MKTRKLLWVVLIALVTLTPLEACKKDNPSSPEQSQTDQPDVKRTDLMLADKKRCYSDDPVKKEITFLFDSTLWKKGNPKTIEVRGSFNNWGKEEKKITLQKCDTAKYFPFWFATVSYQDIKFPGNSGQPEFKFVTNGSSWQEPPSWLTSGYKFSGTSNNQIIVFSTDNLDEIKEKNKIASTKKRVVDFDMDNEQDRHDISNVRVVPGTTKLIRCYHPFKYTDKDRNATEFERVKQVGLFLEEYGVKCDICLSEDDTKNLETKTFDGKKQTETIPAYYQGIIDAGKVLYVGYPKATDYYDCYHDPRGAKVSGWLKEIFDFIADDANEAPFSIHCRLGTDRTGFFCAILAAVCGADYDKIVEDYQASNNMYIKEYRDANMMRVAFEGLLNVSDISEVANLNEAVTSYLVSSGIATQATLDKVVAKLN